MIMILQYMIGLTIMVMLRKKFPRMLRNREDNLYKLMYLLMQAMLAIN